MDALLANPFTYVAGVLTLLVSLIVLAVVLERGDRRRYERLLASGEPAEATVLKATNSSWRTNGRPHILFELEVRRRGHSPYRATTTLTIPRPWSPVPYGPGHVVPVRIDPADPKQVVIAETGQADASWLGPLPAAVRSSSIAGPGSLPPEARQALALAQSLLDDASAGAPAAQAGGPRSPAERLRALQGLRDEGLISAEEHARKRAEILGEL
jgi:hypothetical protein